MRTLAFALFLLCALLLPTANVSQSILPGFPWTNRTLVCAVWQTGFEDILVAQQPPFFTGTDPVTCSVGGMVPARIADALTAYNTYRWIGGLQPVVHWSSFDIQAQKCSLLHWASNCSCLSHTPPASWPCYNATPAGADGCGSNLGGESGNTGPIDILMGGWMPDTGELGHRRNMLGWGANQSTFGFAGAPASGYTSAHSIGGNNGQPPPPNGWTSYPPEGLAPSRAVGGDWAVSTPDKVNNIIECSATGPDGNSILISTSPQCEPFQTPFGGWFGIQLHVRNDPIPFYSWVPGPPADQGATPPMHGIYSVKVVFTTDTSGTNTTTIQYDTEYIDCRNFNEATYVTPAKPTGPAGGYRMVFSITFSDTTGITEQMLMDLLKAIATKLGINQDWMFFSGFVYNMELQITAAVNPQAVQNILTDPATISSLGSSTSLPLTGITFVSSTANNGVSSSPASTLSPAWWWTVIRLCP